MQKIITAEDGQKRFKSNKIIKWLFDNGHIDLNAIETMDFPKKDKQQLAQLLGYSLDGYAELWYGEEVTCPQQ